jgi:anti-sigma factor RsiW
MSMNPHPRAQLSAYLDDALSAVERSTVAAHLDTCADCRARLAELRATASLIRSLPELSPSRRLVPRVSAVPAWLAPLRTLTTMASGVSAFLFIASALLANVGTLATSTSGAAQPAAAPALGGAGTAERSTTSTAPALTPAPPAFSASGPSADTASKAAASPTPSRDTSFQFNTATAAPEDAAARADDAQRAQAGQAAPRAPQLGPSPWLWLALALTLGAIAFALQRRLRSAK